MHIAAFACQSAVYPMKEITFFTGGENSSQTGCMGRDSCSYESLERLVLLRVSGETHAPMSLMLHDSMEYEEVRIL